MGTDTLDERLAFYCFQRTALIIKKKKIYGGDCLLFLLSAQQWQLVTGHPGHYTNTAFQQVVSK